MNVPHEYPQPKTINATFSPLAMLSTFCANTNGAEAEPVLPSSSMLLMKCSIGSHNW